MHNIGVTECLTSQTKFRNRVAGLCQIFPKPQKAQAWQTFVERLLASVEVVNAGKESTPSGAVEGWIAQFLQSERSDEENWETAMMQGYPFRYKGKLYLTSAGLLKFIVGKCHEKITTTKLAQHLRKLGWMPDDITYRPAKDKEKVKHRSVWVKPGA